MEKVDSSKQRSEVLVSAAYPDGTIVETVCDRATARTSFRVLSGRAVVQTDTWERDGRSYRPIRASNNLLRHAAVRFAADAEPYGDTLTLLADIDRYLTRYLVLDETARHLAVGYVFLTWLYDAFSEVPYLRFRGDYGTGKTRALLVVGGITYKPFFASGASTVSPIFHTLDTFRGTLIFDEADFRFSDEKAELVKILNNGNANGFPVLRTRVTEKREFDPQAFVVFGPKIVGMRQRYEDRALESRFLSIDMSPGARGAPINLPPEQEAEAQALRNKLLRFRFDQRSAATLDPSLGDPSLEARTNQILIPLLSSVPDERIRASIRDYARTRERGIRGERAASLEGEVIALLVSSTIDRLPIRTLAAQYAETHEEPDTHPMSPRYLGSVLRRLGIALYKSDGVTVIAPGQRPVVAALAGRYGVAVDSMGVPEDRTQSGS